MFSRSSINNFVGLVGFQNPTNAEYINVSTANQTARSGRYFTDSPFCKIEFIRDCQDDPNINDTEFNTILDKIQKNAILNVCDSVFDTNDYLDRDFVFPFPVNNQNAETLPAGWVGFRIYKCEGVAFKINRLVTNFQTVGTFTLLLHNSINPTALYSQAVTITTAGYQEITLTDEWIVNTKEEGEFFLGYVVNDTVPYKRDYQRSNEQAYFKDLTIEPIYVSGHSGTSLFDLNDIDGMSQNPGINPDITVYKDYTDEIKQNEIVYSPAIQMAGFIEIMKIIIASRRINESTLITKDLINQVIFELEGNENAKIYGLRYRYEKEIEKLKKAFKQENTFRVITLQ